MSVESERVKEKITIPKEYIEFIDFVKDASRAEEVKVEDCWDESVPEDGSEVVEIIGTEERVACAKSLLLFLKCGHRPPVGEGNTVLVVTEKPDQARKLNQFFRNPKLIEMRAEMTELPWGAPSEVFFYRGTFQGQPGAQIIVTSTLGHVFDLKFKGVQGLGYNDYVGNGTWRRDMESPLKLYTRWDWAKKTAVESPGILMKDHLRRLGLVFGVDYLVVATDWDPHGDNIGYQEVFKEILETIMERRRVELGPAESRVFRAKYSSLNPEALQQAWQEVNQATEFPPECKSRSDAVSVKQVVDLVNGLSMSRTITTFIRLHFCHVICDLTFGPCQTPTLALIVHRRNEVLMRREKGQWQFRVKVKLRNCRTGEELETTLSDTGNKDFDLDAVIQAIKIGTRVTFHGSGKEETEVEPPKPLNTKTLLKEGSMVHKWTPYRTATLAEWLYLHGEATYSRTSSTHYPPTMGLEDLFKSLVQDSCSDVLSQRFKNKLKAALPSMRWDAWTKEELEAHPPLTPLPHQHRPKPNDRDDEDKWLLYKWLVRRTAASLMAPSRIAIYSHRFKISGTDYLLDVRHKISEDDGFLSIYHPLMQKANPELDGVRKSTEKNAEFLESLKQNCWEVAAVWKEPKTELHYLREWELVELMEQNDIGTDGTLPKYIEKLIQKGLVELDRETRELKPSPFAVAFIVAMEMMRKELVDETTRKQDESAFQLVADGLASKDQVIKEVLEQKRKLLDKFIAGVFHPMKVNGKREVRDCYDQEQLAPLNFLLHVVSTSKTIGASPLFPEKEKETPESKTGLSVLLPKGCFQLQRQRRTFDAYFEEGGDGGSCPECHCRELTLEMQDYKRTACLFCDGMHLGTLLKSRVRLVKPPEKLNWNEQPKELRLRANTAV